MKTLKIVAFIIMSMLAIKTLLPYSEGSQVLFHYIFGNGKDLELQSSYIPKSNIIKESLNSIKVDETKKISFKQSQDWRLSYAINGFNLTKTKNGFHINQFIKFDTTGTVYTDINTLFGEIRVYDNWVHIKKCTPFMVYYHYPKN
jgi:hypothetical protein